MNDLTYSTRLNSSDALLWTIERDPHLRTTIVAVALLDRVPSFARLRARMADACGVVPRLQQKVVPEPWPPGTARWEIDPDFDLDYHVRRVAATGRCDLRSVLDVAAPIAMAAFDKDRPLWELTLVEGLTGGRAAFVLKVHHCATDGVGAMRVAKVLFDEVREPRTDLRLVPEPERPRPARSSVAQNALTALRLGRAAAELGGRAALHPAQASRELSASVRSVAKLLAPVREPMSPLMRGRSLSRHLDAFDVPLDRLVAAAHAAGCTVNDAFLASVSGGMRRYHAAHGATVERLRVTMPVNMRRADDDVGNNRFTPVRFALPVAEPDPRTRMRALGELARGWRREPALPLTDVIAGALQRLPAAASVAIFGSMLKAVDFVATNIPGLTDAAYLAGAKIERQYAFAPPSGSAFSVALVSHGDDCCIGVNADTAAVPDPGVLTSCLHDGFDEVLAVAGRRRSAQRAHG